MILTQFSHIHGEIRLLSNPSHESSYVYKLLNVPPALDECISQHQEFEYWAFPANRIYLLKKQQF